MQKIIAKLYDEYLDRCQIDRAKMPADQHREMKRAFFGAAGQVLIYMRDDVGAESEDKAAAIFQEMLDEVQVFWQIETVTQDAEMAANRKPTKPAPPANDYIPFTGDWLGLLKQVIPYLEDYQSVHFSVDAKINVGKTIDDAKLIVAAAEDVKKLEGNQRKTFASELTTLLNRYGKENGSNTPDYALSNFLQNCLAAFDLAVNEREGSPENELLTRIKRNLKVAGREIMDEIEGDTRKTAAGDNAKKAQALRDLMNSPYGAALGKNAPEIVVGMKFLNEHQPGQLYTVAVVDTEKGSIDVDIQYQDRTWRDTGWNLQHTIWGFERGEYWQVPENTVIVNAEKGISKQVQELKTANLWTIFQNNSDAFRGWAKEVKGFEIDLLGHQTGIKLPDGVTFENVRAEWQDYELAHRLNFKPGGMMPGGDREVADAIVGRRIENIQNREFKESPHALDEKGFFFYLKTGGIGWCRMYGGTAWFMAQTADGQWYTAKQVNQTDVWNAKASEVSAEEDAALRKTIPNE